jgi:hypothetical protein
MRTDRRLSRLFMAGPIGALIGVGLTLIPASTVQAQVVHHTRAAEVAGPLDGTEDRRLPFPTRHAALYWAGHPEAEVTVSFSADGETFGPAFQVEHDEVGMHRRNGETYGSILPAAGAITARVTSDRQLGRLTILALTEGGTSVATTEVPGGQAGAQAAAAEVVSRAGWNADEKLRFDRKGKELWPPEFHTVQKLVVHHTAGANGDAGEAAKATIRSIYYYHAVTQGWGDIGYNFLVDAAGIVYKGRHSHAPGSTADTLTGENAAGQGVTSGHAFGYNSGTVGVAMLGTYSTVDAPQATKDALKNFLVAKATAHGLDPAKVALYTSPVNGTQAAFENVPGHREVPNNATDCPGAYFQDTVLRFMRTEMQLVAGPADTTPPADPSTVKGASSRRAATLTWPASTGDTGSGGGVSGVAGYDVWRSTAGGPLTRLGSTSGLAYTDSVPPRGTSTYVVRTYDGAGNRSAGRSVSLTT